VGHYTELKHTRGHPVTVVEACSTVRVAHRGGLRLQPRQLALDVNVQQIGHVVAEPSLDDHSERCEISRFLVKALAHQLRASFIRSG
jgi:hypothetical protein